MILALILCAILGAPLTLLAHELSHCAAYWLAGARVAEFVTWPHRYGDRFFFARVMPDRVLSPRWELRSALAPLLKASTMLALWLCLGFFSGPWAFGLALWEAIDVGNWIQGWIRRRPNDGGRARRLVEV
jgi:hypothetical protein